MKSIMLAAQSLMCGHQVCTKNYTVKRSTSGMKSIILAAQSLMCETKYVLQDQVCTKNYTVKQSMCFRNEVYNVSSSIIDVWTPGMY